MRFYAILDCKIFLRIMHKNMFIHMLLIINLQKYSRLEKSWCRLQSFTCTKIPFAFVSYVDSLPMMHLQLGILSVAILINLF